MHDEELINDQLKSNSCIVENYKMISVDRLVTVLGAGGWIGAALVAHLQRQGRQVR